MADRPICLVPNLPTNFSEDYPDQECVLELLIPTGGENTCGVRRPILLAERGCGQFTAPPKSLVESSAACKRLGFENLLLAKFEKDTLSPMREPNLSPGAREHHGAPPGSVRGPISTGLRSTTIIYEYVRRVSIINHDPDVLDHDTQAC